MCLVPMALGGALGGRTGAMIGAGLGGGLPGLFAASQLYPKAKKQPASTTAPTTGG